MKFSLRFNNEGLNPTPWPFPAISMAGIRSIREGELTSSHLLPRFR